MRKILGIGLAACLCGMLGACAVATSFKDPSWKETPKTVKVVYAEPSSRGYGDWFDSVVVEKITTESTRNVVATAEKVSKDEIGSQIVKLDEKDFTAPAYEKMDGADVYIVLDSLVFGDEEDAGQTMSPAGGFMMGAQTYCRVYAKYAIYDAKTGKILAYGSQRGESAYGGDVVRATRSLIGNIVGYTPIHHW